MSRHQHITPKEAWQSLMEGNARFVAGEMVHPSQGINDRRNLSADQQPFAVLFGCSDSRVAAEIIFDRGLGDMFVVRTAGHVVDTTVIGSIEYGVDVLGAPLVVVLGHDSCGALTAATEALATGVMPPGFVRAIVDRVIPSLVAHTDGTNGGRRWSLASFLGETSRQIQIPDDDALRRQHVRATVQMLQSYSVSLAQAIDEGRCAVVGLEYDLADGQARLVEQIGDI